MDISLLRIDLAGFGNLSGVQWSGANNPLWIIRGKELLELKPDKQPVGKFFGEKPFTTHPIELKKEDIIYLFTDGYADQFGGSTVFNTDGKKFMNKKFKELLLSVRDKSMQEQKPVIHAAFEQWKGKLEQVDDVCVIGIKI